jgi:vancomycin resistance protein YoaR
VSGRLAVSLDPAVLARALGPRLRRLERPPRAAEFVTNGRRVKVRPSRPGRALDVERFARSLVKNPDSAVHRARFVLVEPAFTTEEAEKLGISERISEFTTYYSCCQPRVTNIQRAAQLLDGTIVRPGETFSMNDALGERTVERGFVAAPQIFNGRLEDAVGGGISQIATTLYNAAFFAGVKLVAHQAHQFYISRYPMGREATVSWGGPELVFRNDWRAAILMRVSAGDTSISVRFYSARLGRRVETETLEPYAYRSPATIRVTNPSLPPGATSVVQSAGASGFTVQYTRRVFRFDRLLRDERYTVRYDPQNAVVEVGPPKKPKPNPKPKPPGAGAGGDPSGQGPAGDSAREASAARVPAG